MATILALLASAGAFFGFRGQREATRNAELAEQARDQALRNQSLSLSFLSQQTAASGDTEAAILLALEALPKGGLEPARPYLFEAEAALFNALLAHRQTAVFKHDAGVTQAAFNRTGDRMVTASYDGTARIWDVANGREIAILKGHEGPVERAGFSPDGRWLYIGNFNDEDISVLRIDGETVTNTGTLLKLPGKPASMRGRTM